MKNRRFFLHCWYMKKCFKETQPQDPSDTLRKIADIQACAANNFTRKS